MRKHHTAGVHLPHLVLDLRLIDSSGPGEGAKQSRGIPAQTPAQVALRVSPVPYQGWPAVPASPSGTSGWERRSPWPCAVGRLAWSGPEETGSKAETAWLVRAQGQLASGDRDGGGDMYLREAAGAGGQLHGSQDAARESGEAWGQHAPAGGEAPSEVLSTYKGVYIFATRLFPGNLGSVGLR